MYLLMLVVINKAHVSKNLHACTCTFATKNRADNAGRRIVCNSRLEVAAGASYANHIVSSKKIHNEWPAICVLSLWIQGYCVSGCSQCAECIAAVKSSWLTNLAQLDATSAQDPSTVAAAFMLWCNDKTEQDICDRAASLISYSPHGNLARRPGRWLAHIS
jgi:hypothetical protein